MEHIKTSHNEENRHRVTDKRRMETAKGMKLIKYWKFPENGKKTQQPIPTKNV